MPCSLMKTDCTALQLLCCRKLLFWISARNSYPFPETGRCILKQTITGRWMPLIQHMHSGAARMAKQTCRLRASSRCFYGTLYSKAPDFSAQPDSFFLPSNLPDARVFVNSEKTVSIYDRSRLESKDKYAVYFGGNFGRIDIYPEESSQADRTLLIIKDSFANSLVPFLLSHYSQITMLDFRYCNRPLSELMQEIHPDETLVLYEISNFAQDRDFFKILK